MNRGRPSTHRLTPVTDAAYLDHAATSPMRPEALEAMAAELAIVGNASSLHASGRRARRIVEESRESIAAALGVPAGDVVFTSGGTEADNLALKGLYRSRRVEDSGRVRILASAIEHHAVLDPVEHLAEREGAQVTWLPVDELGRTRLEVVADEIARAPETIALVDAVQALCAVDIDARRPSTVALSAHKIGGPHGVGALVLRPGFAPEPLLHGGGQERDVRSGTLDAASIAGFAAAVAASQVDRAERVPRLESLRDDLVGRVMAEVDGVTRNGDPDASLPGIAHMSFEGCEGDALLLLLDAAGVECSRGSACSAGVPQPSHVLLAMGRDPLAAKSSLRFSLGWTSTASDVDRLIEVLPGVVARARRAGLR